MANATAQPRARATAGPARVKQQENTAPAAVSTIDGEAEQLARSAGREIQTLLLPITDFLDVDHIPGYPHIAEADGYLSDLASTPEQWAVDCEGPQPPVADLLIQIVEQLGYAESEIKKTDIGQPGHKALLLMIVFHALEAARELGVAYYNREKSMEALRVQPAFSSMRPFREPPRPPIRRVEPDTPRVEHRPYADEETHFLALRAAAITDLTTWILRAREVLTGVALAAERLPDVHHGLDHYDVRYLSADWYEGKCSTALEFLLQDQHFQITELGRRGDAQ